MDVVALIGFSVVLEPLWGVQEFMVSMRQPLNQSSNLFSFCIQIFSGVVSVSSMLSVASICLIIYALSGVVFVL